MTDVEPKTPNKRKSFGGKKETPKKPKMDNVKTPKKAGIPQQQKSPQKQKGPEQQKSPQKQKAPEQQKAPQQNIQNNDKKFNKKANKKNGSPAKALKPFAGTGQMGAPKAKQEKKIKKQQKEKPAGQKNEDKQDKKKRDPFFSIKEQIRSGDDATKKEAAKTIEDKLKLIQARTDLTKTALRKMKMLKRLQRVALGQEPIAPQQKQANTKGEASKRRERRRKAAEKAILPEVEGKEASKGNAAVAGKQGAKKVEQVAKPKNQKPAKKAPVKPKPESEEDSDDDDEDETEEIQNEAEEDSDEEVSGEEDSGEEEEDSGDEEESDDEDDDEDDDEEESEEDSPPPQEKKPKTSNPQKPSKTTNEKPPKEQKGLKPVELDDLKKNDFVAKNQKRYVVFVGNIPYDTTKQDLMELFQKCGEIKHVRIPTEKKGDRPRGFAYVEAANEETYQKCLSKHHSFLKGRRVNVLYTQTGKKKGDDKKKEIKEKNFKLDALRKRGVLLGSTKESQRRAFRRKKQKMAQNASTQEN